MSQPTSRTITLDPAFFDVTGRCAPKVVELPPIRRPTQADRDLAYDRQLDRLQHAREWAQDDRE